MSLRSKLGLSLAGIALTATVACGPKPELNDPYFIGLSTYQNRYIKQPTGEENLVRSHEIVSGYGSFILSRTFHDVDVNGSIDQLDEEIYRVSPNERELQISITYVRGRQQPFVTPRSEPDSTVTLLDADMRLDIEFKNMIRSGLFIPIPSAVKEEVL